MSAPIRAFRKKKVGTRYVEVWGCPFCQTPLTPLVSSETWSPSLLCHGCGAGWALDDEIRMTWKQVRSEPRMGLLLEGTDD